MRCHSLFFNKPEHENENEAEIIHKLTWKTVKIRDARNNVKSLLTNESHLTGRKREGNRKPRPIDWRSGEIRLSQGQRMRETQCMKTERNKYRSI